MSHDDESRRDRLRALLTEDTGSAADADALLPFVEQLNRLPVPESTADARERLITTLLDAAPHPESRIARWRRWLANWLPLVLLRAQVRVVRGEIWLASLLVITLGTVVTALSHSPEPSASSLYGDDLPIVVLAPLITALGIAYIYGPEVDPPLELLMTTPVSPRLVLMARLALVFGFNLALGTAGSVALATVQTDLSLWPLILSWLAPMTFLSALAFFLGVFSRESLLSGTVCFVLWIIHAIDAPFVPIPDLTSAEARPWLLIVAALLSIVALWLAGIEERWVRPQSRNGV